MSGGSGGCSCGWTASCSGRQPRAHCRSSGARWSGTSMLSLGLDLSERPARAVVIDEAGQVVARGSGADGAEAVRAAQHTPPAVVAGVALFNEAGEAPAVAGIKVVT